MAKSADGSKHDVALLGAPRPAAERLPPVEPLRGQILSLRGVAPLLRSIVWGTGSYLVPKRDGSVVVGATEERAGFDARVTAAGMAQLLRAAHPRVDAGDRVAHKS